MDCGLLGQPKLDRRPGVSAATAGSNRLRTLPRTAGDVSVIYIHDHFPFNGRSDVRTYAWDCQAG